MGDIEVIPFNGKVRWIKHQFNDVFERLRVRKVKGRKVATVEEGCHAVVETRGVRFVINNYRERGGHDHGARVEGDGVTITLDRHQRINAIDLNLFRFFPRGERLETAGHQDARSRRTGHQG